MTDPRETLAEIRARVKAASDEPWFAEERDLDGPYNLTTVYNVFHNGDTPDRGLVAEAAYDNADFIAHARADVPVMAAALTAALDALDDLDSKHQIHGHECLCGFTSARSRSRTEHLTAEVRTAITTALEGETP